MTEVKSCPNHYCSFHGVRFTVVPAQKCLWCDSLMAAPATFDLGSIFGKAGL